MKNIFIFFITYFLFSCSEWNGKLVLANNTEKEIRYINEIKNNNDSILNAEDYKKTTPYSVYSNNSQKILLPGKWKFALRDKPGRVLRIYIINNDSIKKYGTYEIVKRQLYMKRFVLNYDDLVKLNWRIVYDGK